MAAHKFCLGRNIVFATVCFFTATATDVCFAVDWSPVKIVYDSNFKRLYRVIDRETLDDDTIELTVEEQPGDSPYKMTFSLPYATVYFENKKGVALGQAMMPRVGSGPRYNFTLKVPNEVSEQWGRISTVRIGN